jgi:hypothetical protein
MEQFMNQQGTPYFKIALIELIGLPVSASRTAYLRTSWNGITLQELG